MNQRKKRIIVGTLIAFVGSFLALIPYSLLFGWNLATSILFWLFLLPALSYYLPIKFTGREDRFIKTFAGLILFYGFMVFMIYYHYKSDFFVFMIFSAFINLMGVGLVACFRGQKIHQLQ